MEKSIIIRGFEYDKSKMVQAIVNKANEGEKNNMLTAWVADDSNFSEVEKILSKIYNRNSSNNSGEFLLQPSTREGKTKWILDHATESEK